MPIFATLYTMPVTTQNPLSDGGSWTAINASRPLQIASSVVISNTNAFKFGSDYYSGAVDFTSDQFAQFTIGAIAGEITVELRFNTNTDAGYQFSIQPSAWIIFNPNNQVVGNGLGFFQAGDVILCSCVGSTISLFQNGSSIFSGTDTTSDLDGSLYLGVIYSSASTDTSIANFIAGSVTSPATYSISGNAGVAAATVSYSGTSSGSVTADGSGNYTISGLSNGSYTLTASLTGYTFTGPTPANPQIISGANITGVNFVATPVPSGAWSQEDCRTFGNFPNLPINVQGTETYTKPSVDSRRGGGPIDSRAGGPVVDSREGYPANSRTAPPFKS